MTPEGRTPPSGRLKIDLVSIFRSRRIFGKTSFEAAIRGRAENVGAPSVGMRPSGVMPVLESDDMRSDRCVNVGGLAFK